MAKSIPIFEVVEVVEVRPAAGSRPIHTRTSTDRLVVKAIDQNVEHLERHMTNFVECVQQMLAKGAQVAGEFRMEQVEVQAQIGIEGQVGFLGTGVAATGNSQIKIVFERMKLDRPH